MLELDCVECVEHVPLGSVIGYEESEKTASGMNVWHIANAATSLEEIDGAFIIQTDWGKSKGYPEDAYFVLYGVK